MSASSKSGTGTLTSRISILSSSKMRLGLGTAQFGMDYGMANRRGLVPQAEVVEILQEASRTGVGLLDTAPAYGLSEEALGRALPAGAGLAVVTKTPEFRCAAITAEHARQLHQSFTTSLQRLGRPSIYGLLIHHADDLLGPGGELLMTAMTSLKARGLVQKVGVSVYTGEQIDRTLAAFPIDLIQVPINVFDQRLIEGGHLRRLKAAGVEIHARSAFLQGLLVSDPDSLPAHLQPARERLRAFRAEAARLGSTPAAAALRFLAGVKELSAVICGVDQKGHLSQDAAALAKPLTAEESNRFAVLSLRDPQIVDPSRWKALT